MSSVTDDICTGAAEHRDKEQTARIRDLEQQVSRLTDTLHATRLAKHKIPKQRVPKATKKSFIRFFLPDTHGSQVDPKALAAILADMEYLQPREVYLMGDHLDAGGFLAQHHKPSVVAECENTFVDDVTAANEMLDRVQAIAPRASIKYLEGNHEARIEKFIIAQVLRNAADAKFLRTLCGPEAVLHLEKRGIPYISKSRCYDGCRVQGTLRAGKCYVTHGTSHGKNAAAAMLARFAGPVVFGHVHKLLAVTDRTVASGEIGAWSVGCASQLQPLWRHGACTDWGHGFGFQIVQGNGDFLHVNVPIIDGKSYLSQLGGLLA